MQSSKELVGNLLSGGSADRVGLYDYFWDDTIRRWQKEGLPSEMAEGESRPIDPTIFFDHDMRACGGWFDTAPIRGYSEVLEETDEWRVTRNGGGGALKYWKNRSGTPEHIDFLMTTPEIWQRDYRPHLLNPDKERLAVEDNRKALAKGQEDGKWTFYGHVSVWETMRGYMGDLTMYESFAIDPGWIHDYNRVYTDFFKTHFKLLIEGAGLPDGIWLYEDLGYKNGLFISAKMLVELVFPYFAELVEFFHGYGLPVVFHSCGGITDALPMVVDAGFDMLNPMEVKAGCDLFKFAETYGDKLAFCGGMDVRILETNDRAVIEKGVRDIVEGMKSRGARYMFGTDHSVTPAVSMESYRWALDAFWGCCEY